MKDELDGKIMTEFVGLKLKTYSYLIDDGSGVKKGKGAKKCIIKRRLKFEDYKKCLQNNTIIQRSQQRFKSEACNVFTEKVNMILSFTDDKRMQSLNRVNHIRMQQALEKYH